MEGVTRNMLTSSFLFIFPLLIDLSLKYDSDNYAQAYHDTQEHLGFAYTNESNGIDYSMFKNGWCIYVFNLTNSQEDSEGFELVKDGCTSVEIRFGTPVPGGGVTLIAYAEADGLILIDREFLYYLMNHFNFFQEIELLHLI